MKFAAVPKLFFVLLAVIMLSGCGRTYHIKGRIIELPEIDSDSGFIVEFSSELLPRGGRPIKSAKITMFHELDAAGQPKRDSVWSHEAESDSNGTFDTSDYATPVSEETVGLEIYAPGYKTVYTTYTDYSNREPQVFLVVLVPSADFR